MRIIFLFIIFICPDAKKTKVKNINIEKSFRILSVLKNYKKITGKAPSITLNSFKKLCKIGHKNEIRKLFLENGLKIYVNQFENSPEDLKPENRENNQIKRMFRTVVGTLGLVSPVIGKIQNASHQQKNRELETKIKTYHQDNSKLLIQQKNSLKNIEYIINDLNEKIEGIQRNFMSQVYEIKGELERKFNRHNEE